jgi:hypothetical protein
MIHYKQVPMTVVKRACNDCCASIDNNNALNDDVARFLHLLVPFSSLC